MGSPTQVTAGDRQPGAIPGQVSRTGSLYAAPTPTAQREMRIPDFSLDPSTGFRGVSVLTSGDHALLVIDLPRAAEGELSLRIGPMARQLHLQPEAVWSALLRMRQNIPVLAPLWQQEFGDEPIPRSRDQLRNRLRAEGNVQSWTNTGGGQIVSQPVYATWTVPDLDARGRPLRLVVPMSDAFRTWERQRRSDALTREAIAAGQRVDELIRVLRRRTEWLQSAQNRLAEALTGTVVAAARVSLLEALVRSCLQHPAPGKEPNATQRASLERLLATVESFGDAVGDTLTSEHSPSAAVTIRLENERQSADAVIEALSDQRLVAAIGQLIAYGPHASPADINVAANAVRDAVVALLASPSMGESAYERYVVPLLSSLGGSEPIEVAHPTVVDHLARAASLTTAVVGNTPGPSAMCLAIVQAGAMYTLPRVSGSPAEAAMLARQMTGVLGRVLGFNTAERAELSGLVAAGKAKDAQDFINDRFQAGRVSHGILALLHLALLVATVKDGVPDTLAAWNTVLSSATQATSAALQFVRGAQAVANSGLGVGLGFLAGVSAGVAVVVSAEAAIKDRRAGDTTGMALNMVGTLAALASFAGWAISFGAASSLAKVGIPLMVIGIVLSVGVSLAQWIREVTTPGPQRLFTAVLLGLEAGQDHLAWALRAAQRGEVGNAAQRELATLYRRLVENHRDAAWVDLRHDRDLARVFHDQFGVTDEPLAVLFDVKVRDLPGLLQR